MEEERCEFEKRCVFKPQGGCTKKDSEGCGFALGFREKSAPTTLAGQKSDE